jgi:hypothetical protein
MYFTSLLSIKLAPIWPVDVDGAISCGIEQEQARAEIRFAGSAVPIR